MDLDYIKGVNLGNWLVLEKWMNPALFDGTTADDEYYLPTQLDPAVYEARIRTHRAEYINERDFATIASWGLNSVRIPVPYFIFGDRAPFIGCIDELDKAFNLSLIHIYMLSFIWCLLRYKKGEKKTMGTLGTRRIIADKRFVI